MTKEDYTRGRIDERNRILAFLAESVGLSSTCAVVATDRTDRWCTLNDGHVGPHQSVNGRVGSVEWVTGGISSPLPDRGAE